MNIACWSGPRNLSTAMMYAFGARADCAIWDEPYYAAYLSATGVDHPMRAETIAAGETDPDALAARCAASQSGTPHLYLKLMTHHMLKGFSRDWFGSVVHVFLIRHPARVLASYAQKRDSVTLGDIGFAEQTEIFETVTASGLPAVVIDSFDIRQSPETMLPQLCAAIGLPFDPGMLSWPAGGHPDDGAWAPHWYGAVHRSTGFAGPEGALPVLQPTLQSVCDQAMPYYNAMRAQALPAPRI